MAKDKIELNADIRNKLQPAKTALEKIKAFATQIVPIIPWYN